jgi:hypothetical protein
VNGAVVLGAFRLTIGAELMIPAALKRVSLFNSKREYRHAEKKPHGHLRDESA